MRTTAGRGGGSETLSFDGENAQRRIVIVIIIISAERTHSVVVIVIDTGAVAVECVGSTPQCRAIKSNKKYIIKTAYVSVVRTVIVNIVYVTIGTLSCDNFSS